MPRKPKDLGSYERWKFEAVALAAERKQIPPIPCPDRPAAVSMRHEFNRFRIALAEARHPHFEAAMDLIVRITNTAPQGLKGQYFLEFVPKGLAILADELRGSRRGLDSPLRDDLPGVDELLKQAEGNAFSASEAAVQGWLGPQCEHELDITETRCLKCGVPKAIIDLEKQRGQ